MARVALAWVATALAVAGPASASSAGELPPDFYGVNAQAVFSQPEAQLSAQLDAMHRTGVTVVRRDAPWGTAEPNPPDPQTGVHSYDWSVFDPQVAALADHGLRWYPIVDYSAPWAASTPGNPFSPPASDADYVAYARAVAKRYGRGGEFWREHPELPPYPVTTYEIWNEPNWDRFWQPQAGAAERYADLYAGARQAIRAVDPYAEVVVGGLVDWDGQRFIRQMYSARPSLRGEVDAVAYHPYHLTAARVLASIAELRHALDALGERRVPIEVTEVGLAARDAYAESARARLLSQLAAGLPRSRMRVTRLIPHTWLSGPGEPQWGIYNLNATPRPSAIAYRRSIQRTRARAFERLRPRLLVRPG